MATKTAILRNQGILREYMLLVTFLSNKNFILDTLGHLVQLGLRAITIFCYSLFQVLER